MKTLGIILTYLVFLGISCWWVECKVLDHCPFTAAVAAPTTPTPSNPAARLPGLGLHEGETLALNGYEHFNFDENSNKPNLSANNNKFIDDLEKYMKKYPENKVRITGYYLPNEKNKGSYANMGVSRAASIRDILKQRGIAADRFDLRGELLGKDAKLNKPLRFDAIVKEKGKKQLATITQSFKDKTYFFNSNSDQWEPTDQFKQHVVELKAYLSKNKGNSVDVIGHTDSVGESQRNYNLGKQRAREIRKYLIDNGIPRNKIRIDSKGETVPVATNDTESGRAENRRVNVKIK